MSTPIKILHFRGHLHKGADSKPEILIFGGKSWDMGQFIFLDLPCASHRGWPGLGALKWGFGLPACPEKGQIPAPVTDGFQR